MITKFTNTGRVLAEYRRKARYTQEELAFAIHGNIKYGQVISNIERGKQGIPRKHIAKVAEIINAPVSELKKAMFTDLFGDD
jgi:transcriptional regulator with XRE-family HTH domain